MIEIRWIKQTKQSHYEICIKDSQGVYRLLCGTIIDKEDIYEIGSKIPLPEQDVEGTIEGYCKSLTARQNNEPVKTFDWLKAVKLIRRHHIENATAALKEDYCYTAGIILQKGKPVTNNYTYLSSLWATPVLIDDDTYDDYECWCIQEGSSWDSDTKWPKEAIEALND